MKNKTYDILKFIACVVLPALATLVITLGNIWHIPYAEAVAATITAVDAFLGSVLQISSATYKQLIKKEEHIERLEAIIQKNNL